jgi:hypothetical protein
MTKPSSPTLEKAISGREFAEIAGIRYPGEFNRLRRANEEYWSVEQGAWAGMPADTAARNRILDHAPVLVCRLLGGMKLGRGDWRYRPEAARAYRMHDPDAIAALLAAELPAA